MDEIFQEFAFKCDHKTYPMHSHMGYQIIYLKTGRLSLLLNKEKFSACAPCFLFFNNMEPHSIVIEDGENERYLINISSKSAQNIIRNKTLLSVFSAGNASLIINFAPEHATKFESLFNIMMDSYKNEPSFYFETVAHSLNLILSLLYPLYPAAFQQGDSKIQVAIWKIKSLIEATPQAELSLKALASEFHFSEFYLLHCFKKMTGYSIKQFRMMCRLALACDMLLGGNERITEICFDSGFNDISNFTRFFKEKTGYTPSQYRKEFLKQSEDSKD